MKPATNPNHTDSFPQIYSSSLASNNYMKREKIQSKAYIFVLQIYPLSLPLNQHKAKKIYEANHKFKSIRFPQI